MLFMKGHGCISVPDEGAKQYGSLAVQAVSASCGEAQAQQLDDTAFGPFRYYFPHAPSFPDTSENTAALDRLADAMVEQDPTVGDSAIPPVMTYFGQFIDHDVTANTDRETGVSVIDTRTVTPLERMKVEQGLGNLRAGALNLDSLYGGGPVQGDIAKKFDTALRAPMDRALLWAGMDFDAEFGKVPMPTDPARDLLRLGRLLEGRGSPIDEAFIRSLPEDIRKLYVDEHGDLIVQRAIIGDPRNDENLAVAQLHLAFVRFHNRVAVTGGEFGSPTSDREALFAWARKQVTWIYQWLVLHAYLPAICDAQTLESVMRDRAPLYAAFLRENPSDGSALLPVPLEFSVAAFRFGHSMVRPSYDWNMFFGRPDGVTPPLIDRASFEQLFQFTGGAPIPMPLPGGGSAPRLPSHWPIDWARFVGPVPEDMPDRSARAIDTKLARPLTRLSNEPEGDHNVLKHLPRRNLRRGHRLNIPSAQSCIAGISAETGTTIPVLTEQQLTSGVTGEAVRDGGFVETTPLWFYVLKEAEAIGRDGRLGPLGSRLVAETLVGLIANDPAGVMHQSGSGPDGEWHPADGARPAGEAITDFGAFFRAALLL